MIAAMIGTQRATERASQMPTLHRGNGVFQSSSREWNLSRRAYSSASWARVCGVMVVVWLVCRDGTGGVG